MSSAAAEQGGSGGEGWRVISPALITVIIIVIIIIVVVFIIIMSQNNLYALHCHTFCRLRTPLHNSAYYHNVETCRFLVESKADVAATCR